MLLGTIYVHMSEMYVKSCSILILYTLCKLLVKFERVICRIGAQCLLRQLVRHHPCIRWKIVKGCPGTCRSLRKLTVCRWNYVPHNFTAIETAAFPACAAGPGIKTGFAHIVGWAGLACITVAKYGNDRACITSRTLNFTQQVNQVSYCKNKHARNALKWSMNIHKALRAN